MEPKLSRNPPHCGLNSIAPRIPPGRIERSVPGRFSGSQGSLGVLGGSLGVAGGVLGRCWGSPGGPWASLGVPGGRWEGFREAPGGPRGGPGRHRKHRRFFQGVLGGSGGSPGVILVVGGGPGDRPGKWKC